MLTILKFMHVNSVVLPIQQKYGSSPHNCHYMYGECFFMSVATVAVTKILLNRKLVSNCHQIQAGVVLRDMIKMLSCPLIYMFNVDISPSDPFSNSYYALF